MNRLMDDTVFFGLVMAWRFAGSPTLRSPFPLSKKPTIDGVVLRPSLLAITTGSLPSITATQLLVVPKSIPMIFPMSVYNYVLSSDFNAETPVQGLCQWAFQAKR